MKNHQLWNLLTTSNVLLYYIGGTRGNDEVIRGNSYLTDMFENMYESSLKTINASEKVKFLRYNAFLDGWNLYKHLNKKKIKNKFEEKHKRIFMDNVETIAKHNREGSKSYRMGVNQFTDISHEEFLSKYVCRECDERASPLDAYRRKVHRPSGKKLPEQFDLRNYGYHSEARHQKRCGNCYAFCATTMIEAHIANRTGKRIELSVQQVVDCSFEYYNCGCHGGFVYAVIAYAKDYGIVSENKYGFRGFGKTCTVQINQPESRLVDIEDFKLINRTEFDLMSALISYGPVATAIHGETLKAYKEGILRPEQCKDSPTHAVTIFGYGVDGDHKYWILKNSWGSEWGENGYARFIRHEKFTCGLGFYGVATVLKT